jgi:hypothetical protein
MPDISFETDDHAVARFQHQDPAGIFRRDGIGRCIATAIPSAFAARYRFNPCRRRPAWHSPSELAALIPFHDRHMGGSQSQTGKPPALRSNRYRQVDHSFKADGSPPLDSSVGQACIRHP